MTLQISAQAFDVLFSQPHHYTLDRLEEESNTVREHLTLETRAAGKWQWNVKLAINRRTGTSQAFRFKRE